MIPSDGPPLAASEPCTTPAPRTPAQDSTPERVLPAGGPLSSEQQVRLDHDHLVQMVAACLSAGLLTVAEVSGRSEDEVCALIAERSPHLDLLGPRRTAGSSGAPRPSRRRRVRPEAGRRAS